MNHGIVSGPRGMFLSYQSIQDLYRRLISHNGELKNEFNCLQDNKVTVQHEYIQYSHEILAGFIFSPNEQCQIYLNNTNAVACKHKDNDICNSMYCQTDPLDICDKYGYGAFGKYIRTRHVLFNSINRFFI